MSTRSIILVSDGERTTRLYKHHDGYPTDNLRVIAEALKLVRYATSTGEKPTVKLVTDAVQEICERAELEYGEPGGWNDPEALGFQGDLEWIYVVDLADETIRVYGGGYTGGMPFNTVKAGPVDPLTYSDCMIESYQERERHSIATHMEALKALGYPVNQTLRIV